MDSTLTKKILLGFGVIGFCAVIWYGIRHPGLTPEQKLIQAQANLFNDSTRVKDMYESLMKDYPITIKPEQLNGDVEGQTTIYVSSATIKIDVNKVAKNRDRLEPVLAHEIFHIGDAKLRFGFDSFFRYVEEDKNLNWWDRRVEKSAIEQENALRKDLSKLPGYRGMATTRSLQNNQ